MSLPSGDVTLEYVSLDVGWQLSVKNAPILGSQAVPLGDWMNPKVIQRLKHLSPMRCSS